MVELHAAAAAAGQPLDALELALAPGLEVVAVALAAPVIEPVARTPLGVEIEPWQGTQDVKRFHIHALWLKRPP